MIKISLDLSDKKSSWHPIEVGVIYCRALKLLALPEGKSSNRLFETLEEWNKILHGASLESSLNL